MVLSKQKLDQAKDANPVQKYIISIQLGVGFPWRTYCMFVKNPFQLIHANPSGHRPT